MPSKVAIAVSKSADRNGCSGAVGAGGAVGAETAHEEVPAMMLADRKHVQPDLVSEFGLLHQVAHALTRTYPAGEVRKCGETEFHRPSVA